MENLNNQITGVEMTDEELIAMTGGFAIPEVASLIAPIIFLCYGIFLNSVD